MTPQIYRAFVVLVTVTVVAGCSSRPTARPVDIDRLEAEQWEDRRITLTGQVDTLDWVLGEATGSFTFLLVGSQPQSEILCSESGYNVLVLAEVVNLLKRAHSNGFPVTVTGTLRVGPHGELRSGQRLEVDTISILGNEIDTDYKDYYRYPSWGWHHLEETCSAPSHDKTRSTSLESCHPWNAIRRYPSRTEA